MNFSLGAALLAIVIQQSGEKAFWTDHPFIACMLVAAIPSCVISGFVEYKLAEKGKTDVNASDVLFMMSMGIGTAGLMFFLNTLLGGLGYVFLGVMAIAAWLGHLALKHGGCYKEDADGAAVTALPSSVGETRTPPEA